MSIGKSLRIVWAALWQDWRQETCSTCGDTWWADRRSESAQDMCVRCGDAAMDAWLAKREARQRMGQRLKQTNQGAA